MMVRGSFLNHFFATEAGQSLLGLVALGVFAWVMFKCAVIAWRAFGGDSGDDQLPNWARVAEQTEHMSFRWTYENSAKGKREARARMAPGEEAKPGAEETVSEYGAELRRNLSVLGLTPPADMAAIKARYRDLVRQHHPDVIGAQCDARRMAEINLAYDWLEAHFKALNT